VFIWYIFPVLLSCTKENLATLLLGDFEQLVKVFRVEPSTIGESIEKNFRWKTFKFFLHSSLNRPVDAKIRENSSSSKSISQFFCVASPSYHLIG
jgi:hypothetical protein